MLIFVISLVCWVIYSIYEGKREAWLFGSSFTYKLKYDIHIYFNLQRIAAIIPVILLNANYQIWWLFCIYAILMLIILGGMFVFFHDGFYYLERNNMDSNTYPKRFRDFNDSTAVFDFTWNQRIILIISSVVALLFYIAIYLIQTI